MEGTFVLLAILHRLEEGRVFEKGTILNGESDAGEILIDDATGTEGHVTDFAVAGGIPRETDRYTRCLECDHGVESVHLVESRELAFPDGVTLYGIGESPTIEDDENDGFVCFHVFLWVKKCGNLGYLCMRIFHHSLLALLRQHCAARDENSHTQILLLTWNFFKTNFHDL